MTAILGAHKVSSPERAYDVHRVNGLLTVAGTFGFAIAILVTQGKIVATPAWAPIVDWTNGFAWIGGVLMLSGVLGIAGLALEDNRGSRVPRMLTLASAMIGTLWFGIAAFAFCVSFADGWANSGPFLAVPAAVAHAQRLWLLWGFPK